MWWGIVLSGVEVGGGGGVRRSISWVRENGEAPAGPSSCTEKSGEGDFGDWERERES